MTSQKPVRRRKETKHRSFRLTERKPIKRQVTLPSSMNLLRFSFAFLWRHKRLFAIFTVVYVAAQYGLSFLFAQSIDVREARAQISELLGGELPAYSVAYGLSNFIASTVQSRSSEAIGVYQNMITLFGTLGVLWTLRQLFADKIVRFRDVFYQGQYPFLQFFATVIILALALVPLAISAFLYNITITQGIAVTGLEQSIWVIICILFAILSFYLFVPGIIALYIVTLPEVSPFTAYASAWRLLEGRRSAVMLRVLVGYVLILLVGILTMMLSSYFLTVASEAVFYLLTFIGVIVTNIYTYKLYRELL
jgi:hypothetical protein